MGSDRVFVVSHIPPHPRGAAVICCPLLAELVNNYRREVLLARSLAQAGIAVQRFHYRGTGRSEGRTADLTFQSMRDDCIAAADALQGVVGSAGTVLFGTRVGAVVAAASLAGVENSSLAMWKPTVGHERYMREVFRARRLHELKQGVTSGRSERELQSELETEGMIDVVGYPVHKALYQSLVDNEINGFVGDARRGLLVDITSSSKVSGQIGRLAEVMTESGWDLQVELVTGQESWWFGAAGGHRQLDPSTTQRLVELTTGWIQATFSEATA